MGKIASESDLDAAVATIVVAFDQDPLWSWMFPDPQQRAEQHARVGARGPRRPGGQAGLSGVHQSGHTPRYERLGFEGQTEFATPDDLHTVTTMWREPRVSR
ncbi:MAG TPA: hypothetical protein VKA88_00790 [Solirubrobacterales bacterium]|nr:hypothetical protein [Solirubrobacterales bacterium]